MTTPHLLRGVVPVELLAPQLRVHLQLDVLHVDVARHVLHVRLRHVVLRVLPVVRVREARQLLAAAEGEGRVVRGEEQGRGGVRKGRSKRGEESGRGVWEGRSLGGEAGREDREMSLRGEEQGRGREEPNRGVVWKGRSLRWEEFGREGVWEDRNIIMW